MCHKLGWLNWFWQFLSERWSFFNLKGFGYSYTWSCSLYKGRTFFCVGDICRKLCAFLFVSTDFTSLSVWFLFYLLINVFVFMHGFDAISSNIDKVLSINPSANVSIFGDFNVHHKDRLTCSEGIDSPGGLKWPYFKWP